MTSFLAAIKWKSDNNNEAIGQKFYSIMCLLRTRRIYDKSTPNISKDTLEVRC